MTKVEELITDAAIDYAWGNANFGSTPRREVLSDTVLKIASGYTSGSTAMAICFELGLIRTHPARLTKKGKEYLLAAFYKIPALSQSPVWVDVNTPPKEGGRYWCAVEEVDDLGISHYQWNCGYDPDEKRWYDKDLKGRVTHWTNLLPSPPTKL